MISQRQMKNGFSGMMAFGLKASEEEHYELLSHLKMIVHAVSLGDGKAIVITVRIMRR